MKMIVLKCPECQASLDVEENRQQVFCSYCGSKVIIQNENEHIHRYINEAEIKQAEANQLIKLKAMEIAERKREAMEQARERKIKRTAILAIVGVVLLAVGPALSDDKNSIWSKISGILILLGIGAVLGARYIWSMEEQENGVKRKIKVPSLLTYRQQSYEAVEAKFRSVGFTDIQCIPLNNLRVGLLYKPNMVESITINGDAMMFRKKYYPDAKIVITYHSFDEGYDETVDDGTLTLDAIKQNTLAYLKQKTK